ncbi:MAG: PD-(D/E)XK nuclease family protein [Lentisphaeria bacterium]|nr:PD-(D/E)XK nuclease family protein [Lentisphaeria bacterium]
MATIYYDSAFDGYVHVGDALEPGRATSGISWLGLAGVLSFLETKLGLGGLPTSESERCVRFARVLAETDAFWSRSLATDEISTSREILRWIDELRMMGWNGDGSTVRLRQLAEVAASAPPGPPDRLRTVLAELRGSSNRLDPLALRLLQPADDVPPLLDQVFGALVSRHGATRGEVCIQDSEAGGNLGASRRPCFRPGADDDSLILLRPHSQWEAAEHAAAWLAAREGSEGTVVIGATPELDTALARFGLPTSGATRSGPRANMLLSLVPLILGVAESVPDPSRVLELLAFRGGVFPTWVSRRLAHALHNFPGIGNAAWDAVIESLPVVAEERGYGRGEEWRVRVNGIFDSVLGGPYSECRREQVGARLEAVLMPWLDERIRTVPHPSVYETVRTATRNLTVLLEDRGPGSLGPSELRRLWEQVSHLAGPQTHPSEAGIEFVASPGAVMAPAERVLWWGFHGGGNCAFRPLPLSPEEYGDLAAQGIRAQDLYRDRARSEALRWQRPWRFCDGALVLASPVLDATGKSCAPHPFWDELCAMVAEDGDPETLTRNGPLTRETGWSIPADACPPRSRRNWQTVGEIVPRELESPSGLELLLRCPFAWTARYKAKLRQGIVTSLPEGGLLDGILFHEIFRLLPAEILRSPDDAARAAVGLFRDRGPTLAGVYFRAGGQSLRAAFEHKLEQSVRELARWMDDMEIAGREEDLAGTISGTPFSGRLDLRVRSGNADVIVDFKNGSEAKHRKSFEGNTAVQLISYAALAGQQLGCSPATLYFILKSRLFVPDQGGQMSHSQIVASAAGMPRGWAGLESSYAEALASLNETVVAAGVPEGNEPIPTEDQWINDAIELAPNCDYCDYGMLCGKWLGEE